MDLQWKNHSEESEKQDSTKIPNFLTQQHPPLSASALPLFVSEPNNTKVNTLLALSDPTLAATRFSRMGSYFSFAQCQELELQTLIFRYMLAGATVPPQLLQSISTSFLHSPPCFLQHPALLQSAGYWGRAAMDPEPGRCRRTDGKKWRCSRDVVVGQKYCERHMHRGRNRSRKPVELATGATAGDGEARGVTTSLCSPSVPTASFKSPVDILHLNDCPSEMKNYNKSLFENQDHVERDGRSDGQKLMHFFDDWPRSLQEPNDGHSNVDRMNSVACLSISTSENTCSDVSLKLSTGYREDPKQLQLNWVERWRSASEEEASMGGPLAEALRSSTSTSSLPSILLQLPPTSASGTSFIST